MSTHNCLWALLFILIFTFVTPTRTMAEFVVVIDPGHGGRDTGTLHRKCKQDEKVIALNVALKLGDYIKSNYNDVKVVYTRKTDVYPTLPERTEKAKKVKGDLFISIHVNSCPRPAAYGFETYVFGTDGTDSGRARVEERLVEERENLDISTGKQIDFNANVDIETQILCQAQREKHNKQSRELAEFVQKSMISQLNTTSYASHVKNRGVMAKNLFVLCFSPMPAILVEMGYITNAEEEKFINTEEGQTALARGIYNGFRQYKSGWDKRRLNGRNSAAQDQTSSAHEEPTGDEAVEELNRKEQPKKDSIRKDNEPNEPKQNEAKPNNAKPSQGEVSPITATGKTVWRIQIFAGSKLLKKGNVEFHGLTPISYTVNKGFYKYFYGCATTTKELADEMKQVRKYYPDAFFVKFDGQGKRL